MIALATQPCKRGTAHAKFLAMLMLPAIVNYAGYAFHSLVHEQTPIAVARMRRLVLHQRFCFEIIRLLRYRMEASQKLMMKRTKE